MKLKLVFAFIVLGCSSMVSLAEGDRSEIFEYEADGAALIFDRPTGCISADCFLYFGGEVVEQTDDGLYEMRVGNKLYHGAPGPIHSEEVEALREQDRSKCQSYACKFALTKVTSKSTGDTVPHDILYDKLKAGAKGKVTPNAIALGILFNLGVDRMELCEDTPYAAALIEAA